MKRRRSLLWVTALLPAAAGAPAYAQDSIESIITSATISQKQRATLEAEVKRLIPADPNDTARGNFREKLTRISQTKGATPAGLDAYVQICTAELTPLTTNEKLAFALEVMQILTALDNANTVPALVAGLTSPHAAIRLLAARGIQVLHAKLSNRQTVCEEAISALGKAGAIERNEHVLRVIYRALNFPADAPDFKYSDRCAAALNEVFVGRLQQLAGGSRDSHRDVEGWTAATACYAGAANEQKTELMRDMAGFLQSAMDRYFDPDTGEESQPALADAVDRIETVIHGMMKQSKVARPSTRLASRLKGKVSDRKKQESEVRTSMKELLAILKKDPWKAP